VLAKGPAPSFSAAEQSSSGRCSRSAGETRCDSSPRRDCCLLHYGPTVVHLCATAIPISSASSSSEHNFKRYLTPNSSTSKPFGFTSRPAGCLPSVDHGILAALVTHVRDLHLECFFSQALDSLQSCSSRVLPDQSSPVTFARCARSRLAACGDNDPSFYRTSPAIRSSSWRIRSPLWCSRLPYCDLLLIAHWDKTFSSRVVDNKCLASTSSSPGFSEVFFSVKRPPSCGNLSASGRHVARHMEPVGRAGLDGFSAFRQRSDCSEPHGRTISNFK